MTTNTLKKILFSIALLGAAGPALASVPENLSGYWAEESKALLHHVSMVDGKPRIDRVYTVSDHDCIEDIDNTAYMAEMLTKAITLNIKIISYLSTACRTIFQKHSPKKTSCPRFVNTL